MSDYTKKSNILILDGGMGTQLQAAGMKPGEHPEIYGMLNPEIVSGIHRNYIRAGSRVIYSNTFGANARKLAGTGVTVRDAIGSNVRIARDAARAEQDGIAEKIRVALDLGPLGELLEPLGTLTFEEAYELYREMVTAGTEAGADLIVIETLTDLYEAKAALLAAKENSDLPVWVTMSFEANGRTFLGTTVPSMAVTLSKLGADAIGINCSLGPEEILPLIREMRRWTVKPLIVKPNAGLPDPETGMYGVDAAGFGLMTKPFFRLGVYAAGGCCGTDPEYIRVLRELAELSGNSPETDSAEEADGGKPRSGICSASRMAEYGRINVIGERINPTGKKKLQQALLEEDMDYVMQLAVEQMDAGAAILDINVGAPGVDEVRLMPKVVKAVQSVCDLPLQIDSADPAVLEAGLRVCNGRPLINSVNGEQARMKAVLPLAKKYGAALIALTMDESGIPDNYRRRVRIGEHIARIADDYGIDGEDIIMDCLTLTVSAQQDQARETLLAARYLSKMCGHHCALGVSNISFGLPAREHLTQAFLIQAMASGVDFPIVNPNSKIIMDAVASYRALSGEDAGCAEYIERFAPEEAENRARRKRQAEQGVVRTAAVSRENAPEEQASDPLQAAILKGLQGETERLTAELLDTMPGMEIIESHMIPALDLVGKLYEEQEIFLPQMLHSANAVCAGLELIRAKMSEEGVETASRGRIVLATVEGDIHDIGKNIVKVVLENYGYEVIDLGRDVPAKRIVAETIRCGAGLVGLSALMTTTVGAMEETIRALRASGHDCRIMVGGAVLTPEYAKKIGADYYAKDAAASAEIAKEVLG
ncbi:MAG: homocysteine S-methyltransferase family protein [Mogibacterium sp.]|nr:homocysteine S-methyltransferase family protein [Mogibacterium sp.]